MARNRTTFAPGNLAGLTHGTRSPRVLQENRDRLRSWATDALLKLKPDLAEPELTIGIRIIADLEAVGGYIDRLGGPISTRGQVRKCIPDQDRLLGRWDQWCKRVGAGYQAASDGQADAEAAQARLRARHTPEADS